MAVTPKLLRIDVLGSEATLYPNPDATSLKAAIVKNIILTNTDASAFATANLYVQQGAGTKRQISPKDLQIAPGEQVVLDVEITLDLSSGPDKIRGAKTGSAAVEYVINGFEQTL